MLEVVRCAALVVNPNRSASGSLVVDQAGALMVWISQAQD
jgi:hypothetical protein